MRARGGAIDFVGKDDVGEDRSVAEFELARLRIVDADAENVGGKQVGGELDALKTAVKRFGQGLGKGGFAGAGNVFDEEMATGKKGDERELDHVFLAINGAGDGALKLRDDVRSGDLHRLKTQSLPVTNRRRK